ncbi:MAG: hypothetical protein OEY52_01700 [Gammaproteobacteria bacterium]|nr:hypothetical protein [Gammaproteobacteria bacterium]
MRYLTLLICLMGLSFAINAAEMSNQKSDKVKNKVSSAFSRSINSSKSVILSDDELKKTIGGIIAVKNGQPL